jgi:hydroxymethylpyrimidine pyrophosphatase-like HAD family hydrolase
MKKEEMSDSLKKKLKKIKFIILDIDGVTVPRGTKIKEVSHNLKIRIREIPKKEIQQIKQLSKKGYLIGVNSGRGLYMLQDMFHEVLPYLIITYENGSATWHKGKIYQHANGFEKLEPLLEELRKIKSKDIKGFEPKEFIITMHCKKRIKEIEKTVSKYKGVYWMWNDEAYDIGMKNIQTKARGLKQVMQIFKLKKANILFVGDNYNDVSLANSVGIVVSADKTRLKGDIYVDLNKNKKHFPAEQVMDWFLK